jgi:mannose-6-phosphate isomerase-like protein (cupin superfamily)
MSIINGKNAMPPQLHVTPWPGPDRPTQEAILRRFADEGLEPHLWANGPLDEYPPHDHSYHKVLYVVFGSITFGVGDRKITLKTGDRLDLPPGMLHDARVGEAGVVCLEAQAGK